MSILGICLATLLTVQAAGNSESNDTRQALDEPQQINLFVAGEAGYHTNRIPSVIVTSCGTTHDPKQLMDGPFDGE